MPSLILHTPPPGRSAEPTNPLPSLLHTPSGLGLIELQGSILSENAEADAAAVFQLGRLVFPAAEGTDGSGGWDGKRVLLYVGEHQRMAGEVKKLSKPVAVIRRRPSSSSVDDEVEIAEIVYFKIVFGHRPEPMGTGQLMVEA